MFNTYAKCDITFNCCTAHINRLCNRFNQPKSVNIIIYYNKAIWNMEEDVSKFNSPEQLDTNNNTRTINVFASGNTSLVSKHYQGLGLPNSHEW